MFIDPHPDGLVEDGLAAWRVIRGINSKSIGMVYVASHTFHMGNQPEAILEAAIGRVGIVHISDTMDHRASHGLRYITNPPGNAVRVHRHLRVGQGNVDFNRMFSALKFNGFLDNPDSIMCSSVFAENETNLETAKYQLESIRHLVAAHS